VTSDSGPYDGTVLRVRVDHFVVTILDLTTGTLGPRSGQGREDFEFVACNASVFCRCDPHSPHESITPIHHCRLWVRAILAGNGVRVVAQVFKVWRFVLLNVSGAF
jgi:hypothetical protein